LKNKIGEKNLWQIIDDLPNLPKFFTAKVFFRTVLKKYGQKFGRL